MDRETLYKFFEGAASYEEEVRIRQWMEHSPENRREFLKERKIFDSMLLLGDEKTIEEKERHKSWSLSSIGTTFFFKKYPFQSETPFVIIHSQGSGIFLKYSPERFRSSERSCRITAPKS